MPIGPEQEAQRVLTLAEESNSMLKNTMNVFHQTTTAAEYWIGRQGVAQAEAMDVQMDAPSVATTEPMAAADHQPMQP